MVKVPQVHRDSLADIDRASKVAEIMARIRVCEARLQQLNDNLLSIMIQPYLKKQ